MHVYAHTYTHRQRENGKRDGDRGLLVCMNSRKLESSNFQDSNDWTLTYELMEKCNLLPFKGQTLFRVIMMFTACKFMHRKLTCH